MHDAHRAQGELVLILPHGEGHDHVLDESNLRLSKLHLTACCAEAHRDHFCVHLCDNELRQLCAVLQSAELLDDHHRGTNGHYLGDHFLDDHDPLEDGHDLLNHHGYKTNDHRDHHDLLTDGHYLDDRDLLEDDLLNHHGYKTHDHRDHRDLHDPLTDGHYLDGHDLLEDDLLNHHGYKTHDHRDHRDLRDPPTDDHDLGHHFVRTPDDPLDDCLDGLDALHDLPKDDHCLDDRDCPKDDPDLRLVCLNDRLLHRDGRDAMVCRILLPVADDVDRDFLGLALDEVYLQTTRKRRTYAICDRSIID